MSNQPNHEGEALGGNSAESQLASEISWELLGRTKTNFKTHSLLTEAGKAAFKPSAVLYFFTCLFYAIPSLLLWMLLRSEEAASLLGDELVPILRLVLIALLAGGAYFLYRKISSPIVFDTGSGWFWKGYASPETVTNLTQLKDAVKLADIQALQLHHKRIHRPNNTRSYDCYELNVVLNDRSRVNVVTHGGGDSLQLDAEELADFLDVPLLSRM